jgi:hypothetical protein
MAPLRVEVDLAAGRTVACDAKQVLGSPARPLSAEAARAKFDACCLCVPSLPVISGAALWDAVWGIETLEDVGNLAALTAPQRTA